MPNPEGGIRKGTVLLGLTQEGETEPGQTEDRRNVREQNRQVAKGAVIAGI